MATVPRMKVILVARGANEMRWCEKDYEMSLDSTVPKLLQKYICLKAYVRKSCPNVVALTNAMLCEYF